MQRESKIAASVFTYDDPARHHLRVHLIMPALIRTASEQELPPEGEVREFICAGKPICVSRVGGVLRAMDGICPHRGGPLGMGTIEHGKIVCPWHGWEFDPATGAGNHHPQARQAFFPIKIENNDVWVEL